MVDLGLERATLPNGLTLDLAVIRHPGACAVVALDEDRTIVLLRQYRHALGGYLWEVPAGCREGQETSRQCAERELQEEAGLSAQRWDHLGSVVTIPSFCDERIELYLARELRPLSTRHEPDEVIRVERIALREALAMLRRGEIIDAKTVAALYHTRCYLEGG